MSEPMEVRTNGVLTGYVFDLDTMREHDQAMKALGWDAGFGIGYDKGIARQSRDERWWLNPYRAPIRENVTPDVYTEPATEQLKI